MKWNEEVSPTFRRWFWILLAFVLVMLALAFCSTRSVSQGAVPVSLNVGGGVGTTATVSS